MAATHYKIENMEFNCETLPALNSQPKPFQPRSREHSAEKERSVYFEGAFESLIAPRKDEKEKELAVLPLLNGAPHILLKEREPKSIIETQTKLVDQSQSFKVDVVALGTSINEQTGLEILKEEQEWAEGDNILITEAKISSL